MPEENTTPTPKLKVSFRISARILFLMSFFFLLCTIGAGVPFQSCSFPEYGNKACLWVSVLSPNSCSQISPMFEVSDQRLWLKRGYMSVESEQFWGLLLTLVRSELHFSRGLEQILRWLIRIVKSNEPNLEPDKAQNSNCLLNTKTTAAD